MKFIPAVPIELPVSIALLAHFIRVTSAACYQPDGTILQDDTACNPNAEQSYCCATGWSCLSDGICLINQSGSNFYYRGTCTDKSWDSQKCPQFCLQYGG